MVVPLLLASLQTLNHQILCNLTILHLSFHQAAVFIFHKKLPWMVSVSDIRAELTATQNARYKDYQIRWWIDHKRGRKHAVLKTINNQIVNLARVRSILTNKTRKEEVCEELNRRVLHVIQVHKKEKGVIVFIDTRNQAKKMNFDLAVDALLMFLYHLQSHIEDFLGDGGVAEAIVDMTDAPMPSIGEMRSYLKVIGATVFRSFPGMPMSHQVACSVTWKVRSSLIDGGSMCGQAVVVSWLMWLALGLDSPRC